MSSAAGGRQATVAATMGRVNRWYDEIAVFIVPPFHPIPWAQRGGIIGPNEQCGHGKLQAQEHNRLARTLPFIVDTLLGSEGAVITVAYARCEPHGTCQI